MSLKRYLLICYLLAVALFALISLAMATTPDAPWLGLLIMSPVLAVGTVLGILPWANMVRPERRTSFWAYRHTNVFLGFLGALAILTVILAVALTLLGL